MVLLNAVDVEQPDQKKIGNNLVDFSRTFKSFWLFNGITKI